MVVVARVSSRLILPEALLSLGLGILNTAYLLSTSLRGLLFGRGVESELLGFRAGVSYCCCWILEEEDGGGVV